MAFIRTKRVTKNGKTYEYQYKQASVRVPGRKHPKSVHLGKVGGRDIDSGSPAMYLNEDARAQNEKDLARGWAVDRVSNPPEVCDPPGKENAPSDRGEGEASK